MSYMQTLKESLKRWATGSALIQRSKDFIKRWAREISIAGVLALAAAVALDWYSEKNTSAILDANSKATVVITAISGDEERQGSGFFISNDGLLATNYHVIKGADVEHIAAQVPATRAIFRATAIVGADAKRDIALVQFDARDTPYVRLGDSTKIKAGQRVIAIGAPLGLENSVSDGIVSNPERRIGDAKFIQFTAPISPGNSGGGLFEKRGTVIGVTTGTMQGTEEEPSQNINLAVPINVVRDSLAGTESDLTTDSPTYWYSRAVLEEDKHNFDRALAYYTKAISLDERYADAYLGAGGIYYEKGDYESELKYYEEAVELAPDDYDAVSTLGSAYEDNARYGDAIKMFRKTIELKPDDKDSMYTLGVLSVLSGDLQTARELLPQLMKLNRGLGTELGELTEIAATSEVFKKLARRPPMDSGDRNEN